MDDNHPFAAAILALAADPKAKATSPPVPQRNDVKELWRHLRAPHRKFLRSVAKRHPASVAQADLEKALGLDWTELRGVHNGLARICKRLGIEKPVQTTGYNAENRSYEMRADVATTIQKMPRKRRSSR